MPVTENSTQATTAILFEIIGRFERLDQGGNAADRFACWSTAHSMADDAMRALESVGSEVAGLKREIAHLRVERCNCLRTIWAIAKSFGGEIQVDSRLLLEAPQDFAVLADGPNHDNILRIRSHP